MIISVIKLNTGNQTVGLAAMGKSPKIFQIRIESIEQRLGEIESDGVLVRSVLYLRNRNPLKVDQVRGRFKETVVEAS